eukprot:1769507-Pleurochrysis_carterae.AAC.3
MGNTVNTPGCWIPSYRPASTRCTFLVGIGSECYLSGTTIASSQRAERETLRFCFDIHFGDASVWRGSRLSNLGFELWVGA